MPRKLLLYRLRVLAIISFIWILYGIVFYFNLIRPNNSFGVQINIFQFAIIFGFIGTIICGALIFYVKESFNHQPLWLSILLKLGITFVLFYGLVFFILMFYFVFLSNHDVKTFTENFFTRIVQRKTFTLFMVDTGLMTLLSIILLEINDKYGPGMFWSMLVGEYNRPKIQNRIFIFLDINHSTTIAEELGHEKYFHLLRRFFRDITLPVLVNDGEIYQYVGDEIVLTWPNTPENKLKSLKFLRNTYFMIERQSKVYEERYGRSPSFKAGIHAGDVTAGFIGVIKKELIYSGDTLNTTARLCSSCHSLNSSFLISESFMQDFHQPHGYVIKEVGEMELRGKHIPIKVFSMNFE